MGDYSRRRSLLGLVRPDRDRQAGSDPTRQRSSNCQPRMSAPALSRFHRLQVSPAPPAGIGEVFVDRPRGPAHRGPSVAALGLERKGPVHVSVSGVAKGRCMMPPLGGLLD
jgi:hypothetical protein